MERFDQMYYWIIKLEYQYLKNVPFKCQSGKII